MREVFKTSRPWELPTASDRDPRGDGEGCESSADFTEGRRFTREETRMNSHEDSGVVLDYLWPRDYCWTFLEIALAKVEFSERQLNQLNKIEADFKNQKISWVCPQILNEQVLDDYQSTVTHRGAHPLCPQWFETFE